MKNKMKKTIIISVSTVCILGIILSCLFLFAFDKKRTEQPVKNLETLSELSDVAVPELLTNENCVIYECYYTPSIRTWQAKSGLHNSRIIGYSVLYNGNVGITAGEPVGWSGSVHETADINGASVEYYKTDDANSHIVRCLFEAGENPYLLSVSYEQDYAVTDGEYQSAKADMLPIIEDILLQ